MAQQLHLPQLRRTAEGQHQALGIGTAARRLPAVEGGRDGRVGGGQQRGRRVAVVVRGAEGDLVRQLDGRGGRGREVSGVVEQRGGLGHCGDGVTTRQRCEGNDAVLASVSLGCWGSEGGWRLLLLCVGVGWSADDVNVVFDKREEMDRGLGRGIFAAVSFLQLCFQKCARTVTSRTGDGVEEWSTQWRSLVCHAGAFTALVQSMSSSHLSCAADHPTPHNADASHTSAKASSSTDVLSFEPTETKRCVTPAILSLTARISRPSA